MRGTPASEKSEGSTAPLYVVLIVVALIALTAAAFAHPDDASNAAWYQSLKTDYGTSCCSLADCKETDYRVTKSGEIEAQTGEGEWVPVPQDKILKRTENPTGYAVMCYTPDIGVRCFVMPSGA